MILAPAIDDRLRAFADRCRDEGFTALAPDLTGPATEDVARAAADMLVTNWHPRLGVLALSGTDAVAIALDQATRLDAVVLADGGDAADRCRSPAMTADVVTEEGLADALEFLTYHLS
jgi:hypothetical protein